MSAFLTSVRPRWTRVAAALLLAALPAWSVGQAAAAGQAQRVAEPTVTDAGASVEANAVVEEEITVADADAGTVLAARPTVVGDAPGPAAERVDTEDDIFAASVTRPAARCGACVAVADATLDQVRGGYSDAQGLRATFGIERATYINGNLVASGSVNIQDLRNITTAQAETLRSVLSGFNLVQNGPGNVAPAAGTVTAGTLIQNTLSDQTIVNRTVLSATTNSLQFLRAANAQTTLRDALTVPLGPR